MSGIPVGVRWCHGAESEGVRHVGHAGWSLAASGFREQRRRDGGRERGSRDVSVKGLPARRFHGIMSVYERINERSGLL